MFDGNNSAFEKLKARVDELKERNYNDSLPAEDLSLLYSSGELLKEAVKDPKHLADFDQETLNNYWAELARLLISNNFSLTLTNDSKNKTNRRQWELFFSDTRWTPVIKDKLVAALITHPNLKRLLWQKKESRDTNGFLLAMRAQKNRSTLKDHLRDTRHGAEVAWLMQFKEELPNDPRFKLPPNAQLLSIDADDDTILAFLEPYFNHGQLDENQQPKKPDLFGVVAELANGQLDFSLQVKILQTFLHKVREKSPDQQAKTYNQFLDDIRDLGKNKPHHRASFAIFKHTFPLATFVLTQIPAEQAGMTLLPIHLNWYSHKENKEHILKIIEQHLDVFKPRLIRVGEGEHPPRTALDLIIDVKKSGFFAEGAKSRQKLNGLLNQEHELGPRNRS